MGIERPKRKNIVLNSIVPVKIIKNKFQEVKTLGCQVASVFTYHIAELAQKIYLPVITENIEY